MAVKTRAQIKSEANTFIPDNTNKEIDPEDVRTRIIDLADSMISKKGDTGIQGILSYNSNFTFLTDTDLVSKKYVDDAVAGATPTGVILANGTVDFEANQSMGGFGLEEVSGFTDTFDVTFLGSDNRRLFDKDGFLLATFYDISEGFGVSTNSYFGYFKTDDLAANATLQIKRGGGIVVDDYGTETGEVIITKNTNGTESGFLFNDAASGFQVGMYSVYGGSDRAGVFTGGGTTTVGSNNGAYIQVDSNGNTIAIDTYVYGYLFLYNFVLSSNCDHWAGSQVDKIGWYGSSNKYLIHDYSDVFETNISWRNLDITVAGIEDLGGATSVEIGYLSGAASNIQNQINNLTINTGGVKTAARVLVSTNINISSPGASLDGITMAVNNRVVLNGQSTGSQNGVYVWNGAAVPMTRATDCTTGGTGLTGILGMIINIEEGTHADQLWALSNDAPITVGTTALVYGKISGTTYTSSNGVLLTGNNFTFDYTYFSGDVTIDSLGVISIGASKVTNAMLAGSIADAKISSAATWNAKEDASNKISDFSVINNTRYPTTKAVSDLRQPLLRKRNLPITAHTGTLVETTIDSFMIPAGTFQANDFWYVRSNIGFTNNANLKTVRIKVNNINDVSTATLIGIYTGSASAMRTPFGKEFVFQNSLTSISVPNTANAGALNEYVGTNSLPSNITAVDFSQDVYVFMTGQLALNTDAINSYDFLSYIRR